MKHLKINTPVFPVFPKAFNNGDYQIPVLTSVPGRGTIMQHSGVGALMLAPQDSDPDAVQNYLAHLSSAAEIGVKDLTVQAGNVHPSRLHDAAWDMARRVLANPVRGLLNSVLEWKRDAAQIRADFTTPHAVAPASLATAITSEWCVMEPKEVLAKVKTAGADALACLLHLKGFIDLPDNGWALVHEQYATKAIIEGKRSNVIFAVSPSLADPLASGLDEGATRKFVSDFFANQEKIADRQREIAASISQLCAVLAAATGRSPDEAWSALTGR